MNFRNHSKNDIHLYFLNKIIIYILGVGFNLNLWVCIKLLLIVFIINEAYLPIVVVCTRAIQVATITVLGLQHLPDIVFVTIHVAFIRWQIVQVTALVCFRATVIRIRVDGSTTEPLVVSQWSGTLCFIAVLFRNQLRPKTSEK